MDHRDRGTITKFSLVIIPAYNLNGTRIELLKSSCFDSESENVRNPSTSFARAARTRPSGNNRQNSPDTELNLASILCPLVS